jgi:hypothetical protein
MAPKPKLARFVFTAGMILAMALPAGTSLPQSSSVDSLVSSLGLSPPRSDSAGLSCAPLGLFEGPTSRASLGRARPGLPGSAPPPSKAQGNLEDYDAPLIDH